jgi:hypothetical protein
MTKEEKDLLLRDLCARLTYGVIVRLDYKDGTIVTREMGIGSFHDMLFGNAEGKPYLRPMSSMTEEEANEFETISEGLFTNEAPEQIWGEVIDWINAHHFDHRGLIPKGLAIEVTEDNNPYKAQKGE